MRPTKNTSLNLMAVMVSVRIRFRTLLCFGTLERLHCIPTLEHGNKNEYIISNPGYSVWSHFLGF